ncbi:hypothetical protein [Nannocystis bainbridge]|uniref:Uncharacterized protein n=1 Tax=Nannocystis bainbridge TaxID=2995303 RepID=A0ABT5DRJ1_9BACT|nr:hypothetical protein [Nannocystis bainbridge]MDC0715775.1 hypothetical protein [Nannocystis bainbridge]
MAITLNPPIDNLGIMAPVLGPWFSAADVNLGVPDPAQRLGLTVDFAADTDWFAPATGTLSLFVTGGATPATLDALQDSSGAFPFPAGRIVAYFRLLPEVEARLHALVGLVPAATANPVTDPPTAAAAPTRPQVRSLAIVLPAATPLTPAGLYPFFGGEGDIPGGDPAEKMAAIGLALNGGNLVNAALPMTWLRRPGGAAGDRDVLLQDLNGEVQLWAFDRRGRAIDPGAVACWWSWLLATAVGDDPATGDADIQLLAPDIEANDYPQQGGGPVVVQFAAQRTAHLVDAHEGPLAAPFLGGRLQVDGAVANDALVLVADNDDIALTFAALPAPGTPPTADNPQVDDAPRARMAVLPTGNYGTTATLWPGGPVHAGLTRDFVRVAVVDEERHLVGLARRDSREDATTTEERLRSAQNRPSTRIEVHRTSTPDGVLLTHSQAAADALLAVPNTDDPSRLVLGLGDFAWGGAPSAAAPTPGAGPLPTTLADSGAAVPTAGQYRVRALTGGGALAQDQQTVLVEVNLGTACAGAWVRAWPLGFNLEVGLHFRTTGGAGRVNAAGVAQFTMVLLNGTLGASGLLGMDTLVLLPDSTGAVAAQRRYADRRFARPAPVGGIAATTIAGDWVVCETGATGSGALPNGAVPPGGHVVLLTATPTIVDRTAIPAAAWDADTLRNRLQATDIVSLTSPAFGSTPDRADVLGRPLPRTPTAGGNPRGGLDTIVGNRLHYFDRLAVGLTSASSTPYSLLDRLEVAAATVGDDAATAVIGTAPPVPWALESAREFFLGHPGVPAAIELHGTGVRLTGAPAVAVAEYVRERTAGLSFAEVQALVEPDRSATIQSELAVAAEAVTALPTIADGADPGPVVAVLRTTALGMEGRPGVGYDAVDDEQFPFSEHEDELADWLDDNIPVEGAAGTALRDAVTGPTASITRALDRRIQTAASGARETLQALLAAIDRAQDFVYVETPAVDAMPIDHGGDNVEWWTRLVARMGARPGLRVILCVPSLLGPGTPKRLQEVRDHCLLTAVDAMRATRGDRFALFSPGAGADRAVRFTSTSVVIDDAFALTGTTHLWRRGLSWDSSLAAAVFDERVIDGRPQDVRAFRIQLLADRLGIPTSRVPDDPAELVRAIRELDARGSNRLSAIPIARPSDTPQNADIDAWNADGSKDDLDLASVAALLMAFIALTDVDHAIVEG